MAARNAIVQFEDIDQSAATAVSVTTSDTVVLPSRLGKPRRTVLVITNLSPTTIYLSKGDAAAVSGTGIALQQNQTWSESDDGGFDCFQGAIHALGSSGTSSVAVMETIPLILGK